MSEQEAQDLVAKVDVKGDGRIAFEEFLRACALKESVFGHWSRKQGIASVFDQHAFAALLLSFIVLPVASSKIFVREPLM